MSSLCSGPSFYFFFFAVLSLISAFNFQSESSPKIKSSSDCEFPGYDFGLVKEPKDTCGESCAGIDQCTHFTWSKGICYLKQFPSNSHITPTALDNAVCGYIVEEINWKYGSNNRLNWRSGCDFSGSDIGSISSSRDDCMDHCANNSRCTHFSWTKNECYLKQTCHSISPKAEVNVVCGYVVEYFQSNDENDATLIKWNSDPDVFRAQIFQAQENGIALKTYWIPEGELGAC